MVGIKLDKTKIENPKTIVIEVFNIATPTVEWQSLTAVSYTHLTLPTICSV